MPAATPLPSMGADKGPSGTFSVDSISMMFNGERFYGVAGEIHPARIPAEQWREQLLRMRAGGLNIISVYLFWV